VPGRQICNAENKQVLLLIAEFCEHCIRLPRCFPGFPKFPHPCGAVNQTQPEALAFSTQLLGRKLLLNHPWIPKFEERRTWDQERTARSDHKIPHWERRETNTRDVGFAGALVSSSGAAVVSPQFSAASRDTPEFKCPNPVRSAAGPADLATSCSSVLLCNEQQYAQATSRVGDFQRSSCPGSELHRLRGNSHYSSRLPG
jgi:hypothetical protein